MLEQEQIRELARQAVQSGVMPRSVPESAMRGPGFGVRCTLCREPITINQVDHELHFRLPNAVAPLSRFHLHLRCVAAWEMERTKLP